MGKGAHIVLLTCPAQGHINPTLQLAKRLICLGAHVTFVTSVFAQRRINDTGIEGLSFAAFSDGYDDGFKSGDDVDHYLSEMRRNGSRKLGEIITVSADEGRPVTCLAYALLLPWACGVARSHGVPTALLWIQPATVLDVYYFYFNGYQGVIGDCFSDPTGSVELPGLPQLSSRDLPSFLLPSSTPEYSSFLASFKEQMEALGEEACPRILANTFDALEPEALKAIEKYNVQGIGPLIPSAFLDPKNPSDRFPGFNLFQNSVDYIEWLDSKPKTSVVYVSFGSIAVLSKEQMDEIAHGLLESDQPFLWVIRGRGDGEGEDKEDGNIVSCMEELKHKGMIVPWCSQLEVLAHPSLGCFVTHCGWNSTLESLASGVPVVAFPQWTDQGTNAKLIEDIWKTGVRVRARATADGDRDIVDREEVKRCIEMVMRDGDRSRELRRNALKWKDLARAAAMDGGSSDLNLKAFLHEVGGKN